MSGFTSLITRLLRPVGGGVQLSEHLDGDGPITFRHACAMGLEGGVETARPAVAPSDGDHVGGVPRAAVFADGKLNIPITQWGSDGGRL